MASPSSAVPSRLSFFLRFVKSRISELSGSSASRSRFLRSRAGGWRRSCVGSAEMALSGADADAADAGGAASAESAAARGIGVIAGVEG